MNEKQCPILYGRLAPLTFSIGFLESPLDQVGAALRAWSLEHIPEVVTTRVAGPLDTTLLSLEPLSIPRTKEILVATESRWTAYFDNGAQGSEPANAVGYLAGSIGCRGVEVSCIPNTIGQGRPGTYGALIFSVFSAEQRDFLNYERSVGVLNDGGRWQFIDIGPPLSFEDVSVYAKRRISDRLTPKMIVDYCEAMGIRVSEESFYGEESVLFEHRYTSPPRFRFMSLSEARKYLGLYD